MALQHLRSSTANKRATPGGMSDGQLAMNTNLVSPGLFLKDSNGDLVKVGPVHVGTTAPNATPGAGGQAGNSKGEQWLDTSSSRYVFKIWDGTAWRTEDGDVTIADKIIHGGDTDTAIRFPAADTVSVETGGSERTRIDSSGRLLVGTSSSYSAPVPESSTSAGSVLQVHGTSSNAANINVCAWTGATARSGSITLGRSSSSGGIGVHSIVSDTQTIGSISFVGSDGEKFVRSARIDAQVDDTPGTDDMPGRLVFSTTADGAASPTERMRIDSAGFVSLGGDTNTGFSNPSADNLAITTGGIERARIDSSGRLLVGTSTSTNNLRFGETLAVVGTGTTSNSHPGIALTGYNGTSAFTAPVLDFNKSRGTTDGSFTVVASGDALGYIAFRGSDGSAFQEAARIDALVDGTPGAGDMPGRLVFSTTADGASSPTERMRIDSGGIVTIGSSRPGTGVVSIGNSSNTSGTQVLALTNQANANNTSSYYLICQEPSVANRCFIFGNGNLANANNSYGALSDIKLKENISDATSQWGDLKALQVRNYNFKEETGQQTHRQIGLIAQEAEQVSPGLVYESPDRDTEGNDLGTVTKSVNYSVLYMKAVKALQEAMERIEALEQRLTDAGIA